MMNHPAEDRLTPQQPAPPRGWIEARVPAVFSVVLLTLVVVAVWKVVRDLLW